MSDNSRKDKRQMKFGSLPRVVIAGGGPAGSSLAIRLANKGLPVTLIEREEFPREKLCGEFISPECLLHFGSLGVLDDIRSVGGTLTTETRFFSSSGRNIAVPSRWFGGPALGLSRAAMDLILLDRARSAGANVFERHSATGVTLENGRVIGLSVRSSNEPPTEVAGDIFIDATGRSRVLSKLLERLTERKNSPRSKKKPLVAFKNHYEGASVSTDTCEIFSFPGGYGGLNSVEDGFANLCFLVKPDIVKACGSDPDQIVAASVFHNKRARQCLSGAVPSKTWLAASIRGFGIESGGQIPNVFAAGDAAGFIDPFTGSGILMALETSGVLSEAIVAHGLNFDELRKSYGQQYRRRFSSRMRAAAFIRRASLVPGLATVLIEVLSLSSAFPQILARRTRSPMP
ncbi:MAG: NAD(P)/FAD-dependent oxidoreductase [Acidobacteriota bacterium]